MANLLILLHKKKFDYLLGCYLKHLHHVCYMTADPMIGLFMDSQGQSTVKLYKLKDQADTPVSRKQVQRALSATEAFRLARGRSVRQRLAVRCQSYINFMARIIREQTIELVLTNDRPTLDVAALTEAADCCDVPVCYLGSGFFRGRTINFSLERIHQENSRIWTQRLAAAHARSSISTLPVEPVHAALPEIKPPSPLASVGQKIRYQRNPWWVMHHPDLRPARSLLAEWRHRYRKKSACRRPLTTDDNPAAPFVLLPLQGNEICRQVDNPLGIRNMAHLTKVLINAVDVLNRSLDTPLQLVVKEHPRRPHVISQDFARRHEALVYLRDYPMERLLSAAQLVVTFNSLTGFEALLQGIAVVTLGPCFYAQPDLVHVVNSLDMLPETLARGLQTPVDRAALSALLAYLERHVELECPGFDRKHPSPACFQRMAERIAGILQLARSRSLRPYAWTRAS